MELISIICKRMSCIHIIRSWPFEKSGDEFMCTQKGMYDSVMWMVMVWRKHAGCPIEESLMEPVTSVWLRVHPVGPTAWTGPCFKAFSDSL